MNALRSFLVVYLIALSVYTGVTVSGQGLNLFPFFFGDILAMGWAGQFNFDFMGFLTLSAIWTTWRNEYTAQGFGLGFLAFFGGMMFLSIYLLYLSYTCENGIKQMLLGDRASGA